MVRRQISAFFLQETPNAVEAPSCGLAETLRPNPPRGQDLPNLPGPGSAQAKEREGDEVVKVTSRQVSATEFSIHSFSEGRSSSKADLALVESARSTSCRVKLLRFKHEIGFKSS